MATRPRNEVEFEAAFRELYPRAFGLALRMLGNRAVAEDLAAETMARAYVRWDRLDPERRAGWVLKVTSNQAIDLLRRKGHTMVPEVIDLEDGTALRIALAAAMAKLPRRQREAIALRYLSDLSEAETAAALGIGVGSVKTHTHRGLTALRQTFDGPLDDQRMEQLGV
ncbi:MAG: SigE family RNA polymerase sigma factor [Acidimicrobiales bacterium]